MGLNRSGRIDLRAPRGQNRQPRSGRRLALTTSGLRAAVSMPAANPASRRQRPAVCCRIDRLALTDAGRAPFGVQAVRSSRRLRPALPSSPTSNQPAAGMRPAAGEDRFQAGPMTSSMAAGVTAEVTRPASSFSAGDQSPAQSWQPAGDDRRVGRAGLGSQRDLGDHAQRAQRAGEQFAKIVTGDIFDHPAAAFERQAAAVDGTDADDVVAHLPPADSGAARTRPWPPRRRAWPDRHAGLRSAAIALRRPTVRRARPA